MMLPSSRAYKVLALLVLATSSKLAVSDPLAAPEIFCSDLESGPNTGGEKGEGAYVTIYGRNFGASRGDASVLIGATPAAAYPVWSDQKITFQLSRAVTGGKIVVRTSSGASNGIPFTVRPGKIYFVAPNGNDGKSGTFSSPWRTIPHAVQNIKAGDTIYAMDGVAQTADDGQGWDAAILLRNEWCGTSAYPRALLAYPGAAVTIGNPNGPKPATGLRTTDFSTGAPCVGGWLFGGLNFRGIVPVGVNGPSSGWRFVGNDISCPNSDGGGGGGACFLTSLASHVRFYANTVHHAGTLHASALFHGVYFSTDSNHIDMGWNTVHNIHGCRGIQIHSSPLGSGYPNSGYNQYDIAIHDNLIHDTQCDGIVVDSVDPSKGPILIYNNVIYRAGIGPANPENTGGWACINVPARTEHGPAGGGTIEIYNNTMYACGAFETPPYSAANAAVISGAKAVRIRNNIIYQVRSKLHPSGVPYVVVWNPNSGHVCGASENCPLMQGSHNLFFGSGPAPSNTNIQGSITADPQFQDLARFDFRLKPSSPARLKGTSTGLPPDIGSTRQIHIGADLPSTPPTQDKQ